MKAALTRAWHKGHPLLWMLWPLSVLYALLILLRRILYRGGVFPVRRFPVPVIVVGNITVGGTGKTPLTLALTQRLRAEGFKPGVVSRGYGGSAEYPLRIDASVTAGQAGDEPLMLFRRSGVPLVVDPQRSRAVQYLLQCSDCDVVLCDDGLQHYALARDIEIAVLDGARGCGNGWLLPAGPLREPISRLHSVDQVVVNGEGFAWPGAQSMRLLPENWCNLRQPDLPPPAPGSRIHAVAGIGNPERFFMELRAAGYEVVAHAFPDHHAYVANDFAFGDEFPVVMTEKDAVKCLALAAANWWYVPVEAVLPEEFYEPLLRRLHALKVNKNAG